VIGQALGPYEVLAKLGEGGMGEVYCARDSRLNRDVALKLLPAELRSDPDRVARFAREARTLAALNHPNIGDLLAARRFQRRGGAAVETGIRHLSRAGVLVTDERCVHL
jgi:serine/threonine protein kinase